MGIGDRIRSIGRVLLVAPLLVVALVTATPQPAAAAIVCDIDSNFDNQTIRGSVVVPPGGNCALFNVVVLGSVTVGADATLFTFASDIRGSVSGRDVFKISVTNSSVVRGNVTISGAEQSQISASTVRGNVSITGTRNYLTVFVSTVTGSVTVTGNDVFSDSNISGNAVTGSFTCKNNSGALGAYDNSVRGRVVNECVGGGSS